MNFLNLTDNFIDVDRLQTTILQTLADGVYFVDQNRRILYWNKAAERISGYSADEVIGTLCPNGPLKHVTAKGRCLCKKGCPLLDVLRRGECCEAHVFLHHAAGHRVPVHVRAAPIHDPEGRVIGSVEVFSDDTDRLSMLDRLRNLERAALLDELTGIANRRYFNHSLGASLAQFARHNARFGVLLIDADHFKSFNDQYGHEIGDQMLQMTARTLAQNCRAYDVPVRWGGEEFAVISDRCNPQTLAATAERLRIMICQSHLTHNGEELRMTVSIGGCVVRDGDDEESILRRADLALYQSKRNGRNQVTIADQGFQ